MNTSYTRRDHSRSLIAAVEAWLAPLEDVTARTHHWASATFVGARVSVTFIVEAGHRLDTFLAEIGDADLPLRQAFVADISVGTPAPVDDGKVRVEVEALVVDDL